MSVGKSSEPPTRRRTKTKLIKMNSSFNSHRAASCFVGRLLLLTFVLSATSGRAATDATPLQWWKGNLHTHSLWSDGDDYPEMIVDWYKQHGYQFLALSDHNVLLEGKVAIHAATNHGGGEVLAKYVRRFGTNWVEQREEKDKLLVRLKTLNEFRRLFEEPNRFLLIPSEEITDVCKPWHIHVNATNVRELIKPQGGSNVLAVMQNNVNAV